MQIVIDIPDLDYFDIKHGHADNFQRERLVESVKCSITIPKNHGRLIDADAATKDLNAFQDAFAMYTDNMGKYNIVCTAPTVIEADKAESEVSE